MTTATLTHIPLAIGSAFFTALARALWWITLRIFHAPVLALVIVLMAGGSGVAALNALYLQQHAHPAPMFFDRVTPASATPAQPVETAVTKPAAKPNLASTKTEPVKKPVVAPQPLMPVAVAKIDHAGIKAMQEQLAALGFYNGDADGFYGPNTADAIRAFEQAHSLPALGALTPEIMGRIAASKQPDATQSAAAKIEIAPAAPLIAEAEIAQPVASQAAALTPSAPIKFSVQAGPSGIAVSSNAEPASGASAVDPLMNIVQKVASVSNAPQAQSAQSEQQRIQKIQRGLASLGFLHDKIDGVAGEDTAKAIRNFEVYYNYKVTGQATPELIDLLAEAGAQF